MSNKTYTIMICAFLAIMILIILFLASCASNTRAKDVEVIWHTSEGGGCLFVADGMTLEQAKKLQRNWGFYNCEIEIMMEQGKPSAEKQGQDQ